MYPTRPRPAVSGPPQISFPKLECWNPLTRVASIAVEVNARRVLCRIPMDILEERFCASAKEPMKAVVANRPAIQEAARRLIESQSYEADGSILIRPGDL